MLLSVSSSSCIRFTVLLLQTLAKCPVFLQILHCDFRAGQLCSGVQLGFPQKGQFRVGGFFLSVSSGLRFRTGFVKETCYPLEELFEENLSDVLFFGFLSPYLRLHLSSSIVSRTVRGSNRPLTNLSRSFLSLIVAANLYEIIS